MLGEGIVPQSEVTRAIFLENSPCCVVPAPHATCSACFTPSTGRGSHSAGAFTAAVCPSFPFFPQPKVYSVPSAVTAPECAPPAPSWTTLFAEASAETNCGMEQNG